MVFARLLKQFLRARPTGAGARAQALLAAGDAARSRGEAPEAERCWREALALDPENPRALCRIGMLLGERGDTAGSKPFFERALENIYHTLNERADAAKAGE
jgi:tetratricopeptide (TPR) repeat protein